MSDDAFKQAYIERKYDFKKFEILERKDASTKALQIDFRIEYKAWRAGERPERAPLVDTKNRAYMVYEYGRWAISKVESMESNFVWDIGIPLDDIKGESLKEGQEPEEIRSSRQDRLENEAAQEQMQGEKK